MNNNYINPVYRNFLRVICPDTKPRTIQDGKMLMVYDENDLIVGCFFSLDECSQYFRITVARLKNIMYKGKKIYGMYQPRWVTTNNRKKGWHYNKGEI